MNSSISDSVAGSNQVARNRLGAAVYGLLFIVFLPVGLGVWAHFANHNVILPAVQAVSLGALTITVGVLLMIGGMLSLWVYGKGLPMNAYPPPLYVVRGAYTLMRHPIYVGFSLVCAGTALATGSAAGLWLISPAVVLGCTALIMGYENIDLERRFGGDHAQPWLRIPTNSEQTPAAADRLSVYCLVLFPWAVLYELLAARGLPRDAVPAFLPFESRLPVLEWTELLYAGTYVLVLMVPWIAPNRRVLREFAIQGLLATMLMVPLFTTIPFIAPPRTFTPHSWFGELLAWERHLDTPANAFPSYHVFWILLACSVLAKRLPSRRWFCRVLASAMVLSCVSTGMHALVDLAGGVLLFLAVSRWRNIWENIRRSAEWMANSWQEWRWRQVRLINHGVYAGIGAGLGVGIVAALLGSNRVVSILLVAFSAVISAALWAQFVEGSPSLLRPYGYYGGVLGIILGSLLAGPLLGTDPWLLLAAFSVAGPWIQSFGRMRCLVQGCCHGREASPSIGIIYGHPRSRVCRLANLKGVPIHPTPVYSILCNLLIASVLSRLWVIHASLALIGGLYLILTGVGRFVEEAYRGEPQTLSLAGLRLYQWIAVFTVIVGASVTCIKTDPAPAGLDVSPITVAAAVGFGLFTFACLGVDFPASNRRFARLA